MWNKPYLNYLKADTEANTELKIKFGPCQPLEAGMNYLKKAVSLYLEWQEFYPISIWTRLSI